MSAPLPAAAPFGPNESLDHPTLTESGRQLLRRMNEHDAAPKFTGTTGSRLRADDLVVVAERTNEVLRSIGPSLVEPSWLPDFVRQACRSVPFYKRYGVGASTPFAEIPVVSRREFSADIAQFVPDDVDLSRLINYVTSGTTGHPMQVPSHPLVAAEYLAYHRRALRRIGMDLRAGSGEVGVVLIGFQRSCFTYTSVVPMQGEAGLVKLNLHPSAWRSAADRSRYLESLQPEIVSGDPISFAELLRLSPACRPRALFSTSMTLLPGLRAELESAFACPVLDFYSMNEAGPIGVYDAQLGGHVLLQPGLYVELLNATGETVSPGERGEITLTGGFNFCLPLLRYRTGDFASLSTRDHGDVTELVLEELVGRDPVRFWTGAGEWINNVDVLHALGPVSMSQFCLHQRSDGSLDLSVQGSAAAAFQAREIISALMDGMPVRLTAMAPATEKVKQFTSAFPGGVGE